MEPTFAVLGLLPLGLASLLGRRLPRSTAGFGFLAALAPVVASGISSLLGHKKQKAATKAAEEQKKLEAQQADLLAKQQWEAAQNTPAQQTARFKAKFSLGKLAGKMGGLEKLPPSIANYYKTAYTMPEYTGTSSYIPTVQPKTGGWDFLGGVTQALSQFDPSALKKPKASAGLMAAGNAAAGSNLALAPTSPYATSIEDYIARHKGGT